MTRDDGFDTEDSSSVLFNSSKEQHFESLELPDLFTKQKLPLERLFEVQSEQISKEKLFSSVYDSMTKKRMSDIMETIQKPQFEWPVKKDLNIDLDSSELKLNELIDESESSSFGVSITSSFGDSVRKPRSNQALDSAKVKSDLANKKNEYNLEDCHPSKLIEVKESAKIDSKSELDLEKCRRPPSKKDEAQNKIVKMINSSNLNTRTHLIEEKEAPASSFPKNKNICDLSKKNLNSFDIPINSSTTRLKMNQNNFTSIPIQILTSNIVHLDISFNKISSISLNTLYSLKELYCAGNSIENITGIMGLTNLKHLDLSSNKIQTIDFQGNKLERLVYLNLNDNIISSIKGVEELHADDLLLDGNCLLELECTVKRVSVDDNFLQKIVLKNGLCDLSIGGNPGIIIGSCQFLTSLDMSGCGLKYNIPEAIKLGVNLSFLSLENNMIEDIQGLEKLSKLKALNLARNSLKDVHKTTLILAQLKIQTLDIRFNLFVNGGGCQFDVGVIVLKTCFLVELKSLEVFNLELVTRRDQKAAVKKMAILKKYAKDFGKKSTPRASWKPKEYPLGDIVMDESLVVEAYN